MKLEPFDRSKVKAGDPLVFERFRKAELTFKFMGHDGDVVATWVYPAPDGPKDVILHQRDVLMVREVPV